MNKENNNKIIINNYFYIPEKFIQFQDSFNQNHNNFVLVQDKETPLHNEFLMKKRENNENLQEDNKKEKEIREISFGINNKKYNDKNKNINSFNTNNSSKEIDIPKKINIFEIKRLKKVGRKPKLVKIISGHTKFSDDNILRKIKVKFFHKLVKYLNRIIIFKNNPKIKTLKPLMGNISQNNAINFNKILLISKLKDIFSSYKINGKYKTFDKDYNKFVIENIYKENIKELIDILEMKFIDVFKIFRDVNETQKLNGFEKIDSVIREMSLKEIDENYIEKFKDTVQNFENLYYNKIARK